MTTYNRYKHVYVIAVEHPRKDSYVQVWSDGTRQQCSAEVFHRYNDAFRQCAEITLDTPSS